MTTGRTAPRNAGGGGKVMPYELRNYAGEVPANAGGRG